MGGGGCKEGGVSGGCKEGVYSKGSSLLGNFVRKGKEGV